VDAILNIKLTEFMMIQELFNSLPKRFRSDYSKDFKGVFHFDLSGKEAAQFTVSIENCSCKVESGLIGQPDCYVKTDSMLHIAIESGKTNAQWAYMTGKVKVSNIANMMKYLKLFKKYDQSQTASIEESEKPPLKETQTETKKENKGPLLGIRILDLSRLLPGPLASMLLADWGAEVIKIEDPDFPDETRNYPPFVGNQSVYYLAVNRSKKSLSLNLKSAEGKEIFFKLIKSADIVIESFRPDVLKKIGVDYEVTSALNPQIIYVSVTGYGQDGEMRSKAGHDINYIGLSGILDENKSENGQPVIPGFQIADIAGGSYMTVISCLLALQNRKLTGTGDQIDVSMLDACLPLMSLAFANYFADTKNSTKDSFGFLSGQIPNYNLYQCKDGKWLALGALEPKFWAEFCRFINRPDWVNAILPNSEISKEVKTALKKLFELKTRKDWIAEASEFEICLTPVHSIPEVVNNVQFKHRNMFRQHFHSEYGSVTTINQPLKFQTAKLSDGWAPPLLGEDTNSILTSIGLSIEQIELLRNQGVI